MEHRELAIEEAWDLYSVGANVERHLNPEDGWCSLLERFSSGPTKEHKETFLDCYADIRVSFRVQVE